GRARRKNPRLPRGCRRYSEAHRTRMSTQASLPAEAREARRREPLAPSPDSSIFGWWHEADTRARNAFIAASLGWMLDSFDVMLYSIVLAALVEDPTMHLSLQTAGILNSITLIAAAGGGIALCLIADRLGSKPAYSPAVLI